MGSRQAGLLLGAQDGPVSGPAPLRALQPARRPPTIAWHARKPWQTREGPASAGGLGRRMLDSRSLWRLHGLARPMSASSVPPEACPGNPPPQGA